MDASDYQIAQKLLDHLREGGNMSYRISSVIPEELAKNDEDYSSYYELGQKSIRYLRHLELIGPDPDPRNDHLTLLTPAGIKAQAQGIEAYVKAEDERADMQHRANQATVRGYRQSRWGMVLLIAGMFVSLVNGYIFYRQVFDPPDTSTHTKEDYQVEKTHKQPEQVHQNSTAPKDTLPPGPTFGPRK